jgi:uncharacterized protein
VDTLRGVAVLGILAMNIIAFALPGDCYMNPVHAALEPYQGPFNGANRLAWWIADLFFDQKMMSIFSMLFGAGLILMDSRAAGAGRSGFALFFYRRLFWLFLIGMAHAYLIWFGDILVAYAICGVFLYPVRRFRPRALIFFGACVMSVGMLVTGVMYAGIASMERDAVAAQRLIAADAEASPEQLESFRASRELHHAIDITAAKVDSSVAAMRGSLPAVLDENAEGARMLQGTVFFLWTFWRALGLMLIGMGLMKIGVFGAGCSRGFYAKMAVFGWGLGWPLAYTSARLRVAHGFDMVRGFALEWHLAYVGSALVALGYVGAVMLVCRSGALSRLRSTLAAVGRMALSNYLMQSILMTAIFYGWGLGYFGYIHRAQLYFFVIGTWILQMSLSPVWVRRFRFGPAEWAWRSLTYWRLQPMRRGVRSILSEPLASHSMPR